MYTINLNISILGLFYCHAQLMISFTSNNFIINDYFSFASKFVICLTSINPKIVL